MIGSAALGCRCSPRSGRRPRRARAPPPSAARPPGLLPPVRRGARRAGRADQVDDDGVSARAGQFYCPPRAHPVLYELTQNEKAVSTRRSCRRRRGLAPVDSRRAPSCRRRCRTCTMHMHASCPPATATLVQSIPVGDFSVKAASSHDTHLAGARRAGQLLHDDARLHRDVHGPARHRGPPAVFAERDDGLRRRPRLRRLRRGAGGGARAASRYASCSAR